MQIQDWRKENLACELTHVNGRDIPMILISEYGKNEAKTKFFINRAESPIIIITVKSQKRNVYRCNSKGNEPSIAQKL